MDIYGPFPTAYWNSHRYFITSTDSYSRYGYLCLIDGKSQSLDMFKICKAEVENQLNRKIKTVRSDRSSETMTDTMDQVDVQDHLPISKRV